MKAAERLTGTNNGVLVYTGQYNLYGTGMICGEIEGPAIREIMTRLCEYEDTGLSPSDIRSLQAKNSNQKSGNENDMNDLISREALLQRINGPERPEIYDGAQEAEWIERCIRETPHASPWRPAAKPPEDEMPVIVQYHFGHPAPRLEYTGVLSYFGCDPKPHWQNESMGLIVDRWMPVPPSEAED